MKHFELEHIKVTYGEFDVDDKYTLQQIQEFIDLEDGEYSVYKPISEIVSDLRKHGVKIHNYKSYGDSQKPTLMHIYTEDRTDLLG